MRRFLGWTLAIALVLVAAVLLLIAFPPTGWIASKIEEVVAERTGYTLSIGELDLDLLDGTPSATLSTVSLDGAEGPELLEADRLEVALDLGAALGGEIVIDRVVIADAEVRAVRKADGTSNWTPAAVETLEEAVETDGAGPSLPTVRELRVENLGVVWNDAVTDTEAALTVEASGSTLPDETPLLATLEGTANGAPVGARLELASPIDDALAGEPLRLALDATVGELETNLSGRIDELLAPGKLGLDLEFDANADSFAALETALGRELPDTAPASLSGTLTGENGAYVADIEGELGGEPLAARLELASPEGGDPLAGGAVEVALDASLGGLEASVAGRVEDPGTLGGADLEFDANVGSLAALESVLGQELPDLAPASLAGTLTSENGAYVADVEGALGDAPLAARLELVSPEGGDPLAGDPVRVALDASLGGLEASVTGRVQDPKTLGGVNLEIDARTDSLAALESVLGQELPDVAPATFSATLLTDGDEYVVRRFDLSAAGSTAQGDIRLDPGTGPPTVYANLISRRLDADALLAALGVEDDAAEAMTTDADEAAADGPLLSSEPLPIDALFGAVQGAIALRVDELRFDALPLEAFDGRVELDPAGATLTIDEARLAEGDVVGTLVAEPDGRGLDAKLELELSRVRVGRFLPDVELVDDAGGPLGGQAELWASGDSVAALAGSLDGGVTLLMGHGELDALLVELAGLDLFQSLGDLLEPGEDEFRLRCAYASLLAEDGTVTIGDFVIDSTDTVLLADGNVDLGAETIDLAFEPHPKDPSLVAASTGVRIGGRLSALEIDVDAELPARAAAAAVLAAVATPAAALLPFIETGGGRDSGFCELEGALDDEG